MRMFLWCALYTLAAVNAAVVGIYLVSDHFTGNGIDQSVLYQVAYGFDGVNFAMFSHLIAISTLGVFIFAACLVTLHLSLIRDKVSTRVAGTATVILAGFSPINPAFAQLYSLIRLTMEPDDKQIIALPSGEIIDPKRLFEFQPLEAPVDRRPKNLVYIYAEGLDRAFFDKDTFGDVLPHIREIGRTAIEFENILAPPGTTATISGMIASQCGVPLAAPLGEHNEVAKYSRFLPRANCLGDELYRLGYDLRFVQGANLEFAGKGKFYSHHGFGTVLGHYELAGPDEELSDWGRYDINTFSTALQHFREAKANGKPFALFMLTVDTHPPRGYPSPGCEHQNEKPQLLATISCADVMISRFIRSIMEEDTDGDTVIVLGSDHPMMLSELSPSMFPEIRHNTLFIWNSTKDFSPGISPARPGSTFDIGPTVAEAMGLRAGSMGLGTSLFGNDATLAEQAGSSPDLDAVVLALMPFARELWHDMHPAIASISRSSDGSAIKLGSQEIRLPATIDIEAASREFSIRTRDALLNFALSAQNGNRPAIFDSCSLLDQLIDRGEGEREDLCVMYFDAYHALHYRPMPLDEGIRLRADSKWVVSRDLVKSADSKLEYFVDNGTFPGYRHTVGELSP